jgi:hypothetical protein
VLGEDASADEVALGLEDVLEERGDGAALVVCAVLPAIVALAIALEVDKELVAVPGVVGVAGREREAGERWEVVDESC